MVGAPYFDWSVVAAAVNPTLCGPVSFRAISVSLQGQITWQHTVERKRGRNIEPASMSYMWMLSCRRGIEICLTAETRGIIKVCVLGKFRSNVYCNRVWRISSAREGSRRWASFIQIFHSGNVLNFYFDGLRFESWPDFRLTWWFCVSKSQAGHSNLFSNPYLHTLFPAHSTLYNFCCWTNAYN